MMWSPSACFRPRQPGPFGASRQTRDGLLPTGGIVPPGARRNRRNGRFTLWKIIFCESGLSGCGGRLRL